MRAAPIVRVVGLSDGRAWLACPRCQLVATAPRRLRGLLGRAGLEPGEGLLLTRCGAVHTLFMRFAIDVVFLDRDDIVLDVIAGLRPWCAVGRRGAQATLELPHGAAARIGLAPGVRLELHAA